MCFCKCVEFQTWKSHKCFIFAEFPAHWLNLLLWQHLIRSPSHAGETEASLRAGGSPASSACSSFCQDSRCTLMRPQREAGGAVGRPRPLSDANGMQSCLHFHKVGKFKLIKQQRSQGHLSRARLQRVCTHVTTLKYGCTALYCSVFAVKRITATSAKIITLWKMVPVEVCAATG